MQGLRAFEAKDAARAARVQPVFITIDPARDTVPVVKQFVNAFHPRLMGLTGNHEAVDGALKSYRVYASKVGPEEASSEERRVEKGCDSTCRYRWSRYPSKKTEKGHELVREAVGSVTPVKIK